MTYLRALVSANVPTIAMSAIASGSSSDQYIPRKVKNPNDKTALKLGSFAAAAIFCVSLISTTPNAVTYETSANPIATVPTIHAAIAAAMVKKSLFFPGAMVEPSLNLMSQEYTTRE